MITRLNPAKFIVTRAIVFYCVIFYLSTMVIDYHRIRFITNVNILNNVKPDSFKSMAQLGLDPRTVKIDELIRYVIFYERIIKFFPDTPDALSMLGFSYCLMGNYKLAVKFYEDAIRQNSDVFWFYYNLGLIYFKMGNYDKASEILSEGLKKDFRKTSEFVLSSAVVYRTLLLEDEGKELLKTMSKRYSLAMENSYKILALSHYRRKDYKNVLSVSLDALKVGVGHQEFFYYYAGLASYEQKNYDQAVDYFAKSITLYSGLVESYEYIGKILKETGRGVESEKWFAQAQAVQSAQGPSKINQGQITVQVF